MLRIRLQRTGRENDPTFRVVVAEKDAPIKGKFQEILGHYLPARSKDAVIEVNEERVTYWIGKGALPTDTVARLFKRRGMKDMEKFMSKYTKQKSKNPEEAPAQAAPVAQAPQEAPAEAAPATSDTEVKEG